MIAIGVALASGAGLASWAVSCAVGLLVGGAWARSEEGDGMPDASGESAATAYNPDKTQPSMCSPFVVRDRAVVVPAVRPCPECDRGIYTSEDGAQGVCPTCGGDWLEEVDPAWCHPPPLTPLGGTSDDDVVDGDAVVAVRGSAMVAGASWLGGTVEDDVLDDDEVSTVRDAVGAAGASPLGGTCEDLVVDEDDAPTVRGSMR